MRVAINSRSMMTARPTGIGRYTQQLVHHLGDIDSTTSYFLYARKKLFDRKRYLPVVYNDNFTVKPDYFNLGPARIVGQCQVYHAPSPEDITHAPGKVVVTIHDLVHKTFPQSHTSETIQLTEKFMATVVKQASRIICISQSTRQDLHQYYDIPKSKTSVIYNGVNHEVFHQINDQDTHQEFAWFKSKNLDAGYVLFVGTIEPRKNLKGILTAMSALKNQRKLTVKLAVVGMQGWLNDDDIELVQTLGLRQDVVFLGFVSDAQLALLYNRAKAFVFPSFYEGFGFPILEAMACGCPVITSKQSSCGELANGAALTIDPHQPEQIAAALDRVLHDESLRQQYIQLGITRAKQFSFHQCAREVRAIYGELAQ